MATIHDQHAAAAPQPANRGAVGPAGKQKGAAAGGRVAGGNRRVLGDIGNVVHANVLDGKIQLPAGINRPITRSFGAQLLKKAQAEPSKNGLAVPPAARAALKPAARKVPVKPAAPRPELAAKIVTASDENRKPSEGGAPKISRKKAVHTLTTVLNHRSKEACVHDIDKLDSDNELAVVDYIDDIYKYYNVAQHECRPSDYIGSQPEISLKMRAILTDWLVEVAHKFELMPESLYLTMYAIDRFLSLQAAVPRRELQLVGMAAMLIACKYEETWAPEVNDFISIADNAYSRHQILSMEKNMLNSMEWNLTVPTPYVFLVRFAKAAGSDKELEQMIFFFAEMALMNYGLVTARPSLVAASAVYAARCTLKRSPIWTETLKHHTGLTGLTEAQLLEPARSLVKAHAAAPESKLKAVYRKYSSEQYGRVALRPPAVAWLLKF